MEALFVNTFVSLFNRSISALWLILAICVFRLLLQKAPRNSICLLWALVAIRLIFPFSIESTLSMVPTRAEVLNEELMYSVQPVLETGIEILDEAIAPAVTDSLTPHPGASVNPIQVYTFLGAWLWLIGMTALTVYTVFSYRRLRRQVMPALQLRENVYLCDAIDTPFILGTFRPRIYLPSKLDEATRHFVLAHEQAHLQRKDHLWKPLGFVILTLHWFNPLCWLAYSLFCRDIELACDEKVIRSMEPAYKKGYSHALLSCSIASYRIDACPLAFGEVGVKARIQAVLRYKTPARWLIMAALLIFLVVALFFMTNRATVPDEDEIFGHYYETFQNIYSSPPLVESNYEVQYLPMFDVRENRSFARKHELYDSRVWEEMGELEPWELSRDNFDVLFREQKKNENGPWSWPEDESWFRRQNYKAWRVIKADDFYILMLQKDGSVLLCHGYYDTEGESDPYSDDSAARWMVLLRRIDEELTAVPTGDPFKKAASPYQWTNNITAEQVEWVSVTIWGEEAVHHQPADGDVEQLTAILRRMTPEQVYEDGLRRQHTVSVMVYCYGREYLLQYLGDGVIQMTFDRATAELYGDKRWFIEDEVLGQWMEQWLAQGTIDPIQWQYTPQLSSQYPAFPVFFGFDYTNLKLSGPNGTRQMIVGGVVDNNNKVYAGGNGFCWSPLTEHPDAEKALIALTSEVEMIVTDTAGENLRGTLYFEVNDLPDRDGLDWVSSAAASSLALPIYTIRLESEDLYIAENPDGQGILLQKVK